MNEGATFVMDAYYLSHYIPPMEELFDDRLGKRRTSGPHRGRLAFRLLALCSAVVLLRRLEALQKSVEFQFPANIANVWRKCCIPIRWE